MIRKTVLTTIALLTLLCVRVQAAPTPESVVKETIVNTVYSKKYIPDTPEALRERQIKTKIQPEILEEQIEYKDSIGYKLGTFKYIYDIENEKLYYDDAKSNFFKLNDDKTKIYRASKKIYK